MTRQSKHAIGMSLSILAATLLAAASATADTLHVPAEYATIQAAIDAAADSDVVELADGTYTGPGNRDLNLHGKAITVRSASGEPALCIIDCQEAGRGFHFHSGEGPDSRVEGLTITNGSGSSGGGAVKCANGSPTIVNCTITRNRADDWGGGILCSCESTAVFTSCTISANRAYHGGGVYSGGGEPALVNCTITGNHADDQGGGVYCGCSLAPPMLVNCAITANTAAFGGGVFCDTCDPTLRNCLIAGNSAENSGGAVRCWDSQATLTNCTLTGNSAGSGAGGIHCAGASLVLTNCILWGDSPPALDGVADATVTYCDVQGGWPGEGNIDAEPFGLPGDVYPAADSPCLDAGTNDPPGGLSPEDLDGNPRLLDGDGDTVAVVDMGVYEFNPAMPSIGVSPPEVAFFGLQGGEDPADQVLSVRNCGGGTLSWQISGQPAWLTVEPAAGDSTGEVDEATLSVNTGGLPHGAHTAVLQISDPQAVNSPRSVVVTVSVFTTLNVPSEYPTIQAAIDAALPSHDEIVLADGTYAGPGNRNLDFGGKAIVLRSTSGDPALCTIDCEGKGRGFHFHSGEGPDSVVEGVTITNGSALTGGGVYCYNDSSPTFNHCRITASFSHGDGGGVRCQKCFHSSPTFTRCTITGNSADDDGGGVSCDGSNPTLTNCTISDNSAGGSGGGFASEGVYGFPPTLANCLLQGNSADEGGALYFSNSEATVTNCTIVENMAADDGGGVYTDAGSAPTLTNCILWGDSPQELHIDGGDLVVTYSDIQGGWPGEGNIDAQPFALPGELRIAFDSPCIDAGTNEPPGGLPPEDLDGDPRPLDGDGDTVAVADMGVYEFNPAVPRLALDPVEFLFSAAQGGESPAGQALSIRNCGGGTLEWQISGQPGWLTTDPPSGESSGQIDKATLLVDTTGLTHGLYTAVLEVADPLAASSPRVVTVTLYVTSTLQVPAAYPTIQAALDAALPAGDEIILADQTYTGPGNRDLDFGGKAVALRSASGDPSLCTINCLGQGRGFHFRSGEGPDSIVEGLTITCGSAAKGGAVSCENASSPTFNNCVLTDSIGADSGGALYCHDHCDPTFTGCALTDNAATEGGAVYCDSHSRPKFVACAITDNYAYGSGGGALCTGGSWPTLTGCAITDNTAQVGNGGGLRWAIATLTDCTILRNQAGNSGGGIHGGSSSITGCTISGNEAGGHGGGVYGSSAVLTNCTIGQNRTVYHGGGVYCFGGNARFMNCRITGNQADDDVGGVYLHNNDATLVNCTIRANTGGFLCGGLHCENSSPAVTNCIFWHDTPLEITVQWGDPVVTYCDVEGGWFGTGNFQAPPWFVDPKGPDGIPGTADDDLRLGVRSPCIDAGDSTAVPADTADLDGDGDIDERTPLDLAGGPRFLDDPTSEDAGVADPPEYPEVVDIGAYEFVPDCNTNGVPDAWEDWQLEAVRACSRLEHGEAGDFCLELLDGPDAPAIEPRVAGVRELLCRMNVSADPATVTADHVHIDCVEADYAGMITTSLDDAADCPGSVVVVTFDPPLPDQDCCRITLEGMTTAYGQPGTIEFAVRTLAGDVTGDGVVNTEDSAAVKPRFGGTPDESDYRYDVDASGRITSVDASTVKPRFGHTAPDCP